MLTPSLFALPYDRHHQRSCRIPAFGAAPPQRGRPSGHPARRTIHQEHARLGSFVSSGELCQVGAVGRAPDCHRPRPRHGTEPSRARRMVELALHRARQVGRVGALPDGHHAHAVVHVRLPAGRDPDRERRADAADYRLANAPDDGHRTKQSRSVVASACADTRLARTRRRILNAHAGVALMSGRC